MEAPITPWLGIAEPVSALTHLLGAVVAVLLFAPLLRTARAERGQAVCLGVFAASVGVLMTSSGLYHFFPLGSEARWVLRRMDHIGIWLTTAGCATPIWYFYLRGRRFGFALLVLMWAGAFLGAGLKVAHLEALPAWLGVLLYVGYGAVGIPVAIWLVATRGLRYMFPYFLCGVCLTLGALVELVEEPTLVSGVVGYHEVVHVFVMSGLFFHWGFLHRVSSEVAGGRSGEGSAAAAEAAAAVS